LAGTAAYAAFLILSRQTPVPEQSIAGNSVSDNAATVVIASRSGEETEVVETSNPSNPLIDAQSDAEPSPPADNEKTETPSISETATTAVIPRSEAEVNKTDEDQTPTEAVIEREPSPPSILDEPKSMPEEQIEMARDRSVPADSVSESQTKNGQLAEQENDRSRSSDIVTDGLKGAEWLMSQSPDAYTLQIVAVSRLSSLLKLARQFPPGSELASFRSRKGNGELYPLFFGIYPSLQAAKDAAANLPASLGQPLLRQMKSVHQEIRRVMPRQAEPSTSADSPAR
jgi:DamX protein